MKKINTLVSFICLSIVSGCLFAATSTATTADASPVGYWKTIDDQSGKPKSIVKLTQTADQLLQGEVVKLFKDALQTCAECDGDLKNKPILGMQVLRGLKQSTDDPNYWSSGEVFDPKNGKTYKCNIQLVEEGKKIQLRGYIGLPLFGRTQTWIRVNDQKSD